MTEQQEERIVQALELTANSTSELKQEITRIRIALDTISAGIGKIAVLTQRIAEKPN